MNPYGPFLGARLAHAIEFGDRRHELPQVLVLEIIDPWYRVAVSQEMQYPGRTTIRSRHVVSWFQQTSGTIADFLGIVAQDLRSAAFALETFIRSRFILSHFSELLSVRNDFRGVQWPGVRLAQLLHMKDSN